MKSTLLKTLAAASLVATTHAQVHVMGASWKERGVNAPLGTILPNPGTVAAPRAYLIMDNTVLTATPSPAIYIEYGERRAGGVVDRYYTTDTDFTAFLADGVFGDSGGRRLYGHMHVPVTIADVTNPMIPFSGTTYSTNFPRKISFDQTVFQTGASDTATGPQIVLANARTLRSVMSGSANPVKVSATDKAGAADELITRLKKQGYTRDVVEAPKIVTNPPATVQIVDGQSSTLSVVLSPDSVPGVDDDFAAPTYQWFKDAGTTPVGTGATFTVLAGTSTATNGYGTYKVVVTNSFGSATSTNSVVSAANPAIVTNLPATASVTGAGATAPLGVTLNPVPVPTATYQWLKSPTGVAGSFVNVDTTVGGKSAKLVVIGGEALTGAGFYRLDVTTSAGTIPSAVCNVTVNAIGSNFGFTANLPRTRALALDAVSTLSVTVNPTPAPAVDKYEWFKAPLSNPTAFTLIASGTSQNTLQVSGNAANEKGPGVYHVRVTSVGATPTVITSLDCTVTTTP